jgi:alkylhydroperoxidase/carboxymuconolactone decarboxylase family protein YurZ
MKDLYQQFTNFKEKHPTVHAKYEELGQEIHENGGPLDEKTRWLLKISMSAVTANEKALRTHMYKATNAKVTHEEIEHALLLLIPTIGFPGFMRAWGVYDRFCQEKP